MSVKIDTVVRTKNGAIVEGARKGVGFRALVTGTGVGPGDMQRCVEVLEHTLGADDALTPAQIATKYTDLPLSLGSVTITRIQART